MCGNPTILAYARVLEATTIYCVVMHCSASCVRISYNLLILARICILDAWQFVRVYVVSFSGIHCVHYGHADMLFILSTNYQFIALSIQLVRIPSMVSTPVHSLRQYGPICIE